MTDVIPGQQQLLSMSPTVPASVPPGVLPKNRDIVLTAEQVEQARLEWPNDTERKQLSNMRSRVRAKMGHAIVVDGSGRRAFGGPQRSAEKKRIGQSIAEEADERRREIIDAAFSGLSPKEPTDLRVKTALAITRVAREERELEIKEDELERASNEELESEATKIIAGLVRSGKLSIEDIMGPPVVDATVVDG